MNFPRSLENEPPLSKTGDTSLQQFEATSSEIIPTRFHATGGQEAPPEMFARTAPHRREEKLYPSRVTLSGPDINAEERGNSTQGSFDGVTRQSKRPLPRIDSDSDMGSHRPGGDVDGLESCSQNSAKLAADNVDKEHDADLTTANITCPICGNFQGDEASVSFHVNTHFE